MVKITSFKHENLYIPNTKSVTNYMTVSLRYDVTYLEVKCYS